MTEQERYKWGASEIKREISKTIICEWKRFDEAFYLNPVCNQRLLSDYIGLEACNAEQVWCDLIRWFLVHLADELEVDLKKDTHATHLNASVFFLPQFRSFILNVRCC